MAELNADTTVGQLVAEQPARAKLFERLGIDYCCGGKLPLSRACAEKGLDVKKVLGDIRADDLSSPASAGRQGQEGGGSPDWSQTSTVALVDHILATHHAYLREELPRLAGLLQAVVQAHGEHHPELAEVRDVYESVRAELESHMDKEEQILFPMIKALASADPASPAPAFHCGSVANPIRVMEMEHQAAGDALAAMRQLTHDYATPADGCNTYRAAMDGLARLEADLHQHIHKENNILFPRVLQAEAAACGAGR